MSTLLSFGETLIDFLPHGGLLLDQQNQTSYLPLCGGAPANVAVAYAKLGGDSYFAGGISRDNFGQLLQQQLTHYGVHSKYIEIINDHPSAVVLVSLDTAGEREFTFYRDNSADMHYRKEYIDNIEWSAIDIFHFCSNTLTTPKMAKVTTYGQQQAKAAQTLISFDINLRQALWKKREQLPEQVENCFVYCDILKFSKEELNYLALQKGCDHQNYLRFCLQQGVSLILVTNGAADIEVVNQNSRQYFTPPPVKAVDTTGAGDSFIAGFLYAIGKHQHTSLWLKALTNVADLHFALEFASQCSAATCCKKGAFPALPSLNELHR